MSNIKNYITSAFLAGSILALLSAIPYLSSLNCCCCLWLVCGGFWASYLFWDEERIISIGQGIVVGVLAGMWASLVYSLLTTIMWRTMSAQFATQINEIIGSSRTEMPPEMLDLFTQFATSPVFMFLILLSGTIIVFPTVVTIGSTIGSTILVRRARR